MDTEAPYIVFYVEKEEDYEKITEKLPNINAEKVLPVVFDNLKRFVIIANSPKTTLQNIKEYCLKFGIVTHAVRFNVPKSLKVFFAVTFEDSATADLLAKKKIDFIFQDLIFLEKFDDKKSKNISKRYVLKLSNLSLGTTDWKLKITINELNAISWRVPFTKHGKRLPICYSSFESEEDKFLAERTKLQLFGLELMWSELTKSYVKNAWQRITSLKTASYTVQKS